MRRYHFLTKFDVFEALNRLRASFLAAKDGRDVESILKGILTHDERMKIGRRIIVASMLINDYSYGDIQEVARVGKSTISNVDRKLKKYPDCFKLVFEREDKVEKEFRRKAYQVSGGPMLVKKRKEYTGFKRKDVKR